MKKKPSNDVLSKEDLGFIFTCLNEMSIISQLSSNALEKNLPSGLSLSQFYVLGWFLRVDTEATPGRLATAFMVTKGAMTNTLKKLESKGLVKIRVDESSARRKLVTLTKAGKKMREVAVKTSSKYIQDLGAEFPYAEFKKQLPFLQELRIYLDEKRYT